MNKVQFIGRITKDLELTTTNSGLSVVKFNLAVNRKFKGENGNYVTDFFNIVAWRGLADNIYKYCHKGSKVYVEGELQTRSYDAQDGSKRYVTEVIINDCEFLDSKNTGTATEQTTGADVLQPINDDSLPF